MVKWTVLKPIQDVWPHVATSALVLNLLVSGVFCPITIAMTLYGVIYIYILVTFHYPVSFDFPLTLGDKS